MQSAPDSKFALGWELPGVNNLEQNANFFDFKT